MYNSYKEISQKYIFYLILLSLNDKLFSNRILDLDNGKSFKPKNKYQNKYIQ